MKTKMIYAIKDGVLTDISKVESGLKCGCVCPLCHSQLIANKGEIKSHYFSHYNAEECAGGYQTSLHLLAKEIIEEDNYFLYPAYRNSFISVPAKSQKIDKVELESRIGGIIPDLLITFGTRKLLVEIFVTHKIDNAKLSKIKSLDISAIEIDLSKINRQITKDELRDILHSNLILKKWIYNAKFDKLNDKLNKEIFALSKKYKIYNTDGFFETSKIYECPYPSYHRKPQSYSLLCFDCKECHYFLGVETNDKDESENIYCYAENKERVSELQREIKLMVKKYK